ncbi:MAG: haloacid dehalogenase-like hydrolase [Acidobacteria bacterium]|nr:haloacid dehalogenase-like hydrolase [Acidobacteriota bacterium]
MTKSYLIASDFDQTLSFNDSGIALAEMLGISNFEEKVRGLSRIGLVQQGAELAYLLRHDPEFRRVRREHLIETGKRIRLKKNVSSLVEALSGDIDGNQYSFYVISAAPKEVVVSALEGIVPADHIFGTELGWEPGSGEISSILRTPAGYGKVLVLNELQASLQMRPDHTVYIGDGSSDLYVMKHVNSCDGFTIAVSEAKYITRIAKRTVLSDNALSVFVPILEDIAGWNAVRIREWFGAQGLTVQEWDKVRTDWLTLREAPPSPLALFDVPGKPV